MNRGYRIICTTLAAALASCASGPPFVQPETPSSGQAVVYLYRPMHFVQGGNIYKVTLAPSDQVVRLSNGGWTRLEVPPGTYNLLSIDQIGLMGCARRPIALGEGHTVYLRLDVDLRMGSHANEAVHSCKFTAMGADAALPVMTGMPRSE